jgi:hypothetical protein
MTKELNVKLPHQRTVSEALAGMPPTIDADELEDGEQAPQGAERKMVEATAKVTIEIPVSLHRKIKRGLIDRDLKLKDELRKAVDKYFAKW